MTYSRDIPEAQLTPAATQAQIQTNFAQWAAQFVKNHSAMNSSNQGDHEAVILENQSVVPTVLQDIVTLYCKNATSQLGTQPQLFARIKQFIPLITNSPMQLTYDTVNTAGPSQYQSFLMGGLLIFFGSTNNIANIITLIPSPTASAFAMAFPSNLNGGVPNNVSTRILTANTIKIDSTSAIAGDIFYWISIGKA